MTRPVASDRRGVVIGVALVVTMAVGAAIVALGGERPAPSPAEASAVEHGTRPPPLTERAVERAAAAFGIGTAPDRVPGGWEAEDRTRSLYLLRSPSAWYVSFEDASTLLEPPGDRVAICSRAGAPFACTRPEVPLVADAGAAAPDRATAAHVVRRTLARAGLLAGRWTGIVLDPSRDAVPCRTGLTTEFDCTRQVVATRAVMLTRDFGPGTTAARFGVVVGPRGNILTVTGRVAERSL
jgi:hypothetical protein